MVRAALGEHLAPFGDPGREVLFARPIYSVEPYERVWPDTSVTPVPGFGGALHGTRTPILIVVSVTLKMETFSIDDEIDNGVCVWYSVRPPYLGKSSSETPGLFSCMGNEAVKSIEYQWTAKK
ncbi:hypothetical protein ACKAV7_004184 [Fusarium commune]